MATPLANALRQVLGKESDLIVIDYRDKNTFSDLWLHGLTSDKPTIRGLSCNWNDPNSILVIVGSLPPSEMFTERQSASTLINFRDHFTAASWLAAWKLTFTPDQKNEKQRRTEPLVRIAIIDPNTSEVSGPAARAIQTLFGAKDATGKNLAPRATVLRAPSLKSISKWIHDAKTDAHDTPQNVCDLLKSTIWAELTSNRERHHAISNVLGAFLLRREVRGESASDSIIDQLLEQLVKSVVDLQLDDSGRTLNELVRELFETASKSRNHAVRELQYALIDDMVDLWEPFLRGVLDLQDSNRLHTASGEAFGDMIESLPTRLENFLGRQSPSLSIGDLFEDGPTDIRNFVLFLDLRLFPKSDATKEKSEPEKKFIKDLVDFGIKLIHSERNLPWLNGTRGKDNLSDELDALRCDAKVASSPGKSAPPPDETLLARLVSLLDPTLPIVVFSSTHRTELTAAFRDYGNIITTFRKPILSGMTGDWTAIFEELRADFIDAMQRAAAISETRRLLAEIAS
ncbi:MAG TPA: hypothetical protein VJU77_16785 [Chthoniobacterales bacterium]|nr:hypothetical protein [Chthoniobacterales bacterium]